MEKSDLILKLFQWAKREGCRGLEKLKVLENSMRSVITLTDINIDDEIIFIPTKLLFSLNVCNIDSNIHSILKSTLNGVELDMAVMTVYMCNENWNTKSSFWEPYLQSLPKTLNLPICWSREEIDLLLSGSNLHFITIDKLNWIDRIITLLSKTDLKIEKSQFIWGFALITSRAFPKSNSILDSHGNSRHDWISLSEICLYPILDLLNHKSGQMIEWQMNGDGVGFVAKELISAGFEVYNNYGPKGNENLLNNYGFVLEDNSKDYYKITLATTKLDPLVGKRNTLLQSLNLPKSFLLFINDTEIGNDLMMTAKIMVADKFELYLLSKDLNFKSSKLDYVCLNTLIKLLEQKLNALVLGSISCMGTKDQIRSKMVMIYRNGQESILKHYIQLAMNNLEICKSNFYPLTLEDNRFNIDDEFVLLVFHLLTTRPKCWSQFTAVKCRKILGREEYEIFKDFYTEFGEFKRSFSQFDFLTSFTISQVFSFSIGSNFGIFK